MPLLQEQHWQFSKSAGFSDGAQFAANLLRAGVAEPEDWGATRSVGGFLQKALENFVGDRAEAIDSAFDISVCLGTNASSWRDTDEINPRRVLITFRVAQRLALALVSRLRRWSISS